VLRGENIAKRFQGSTFDFDAVPEALKKTMRTIDPEEHKKKLEARRKASWGAGASALDGKTEDRMSPPKTSPLNRT
jgi:hypothetical protein